ncbi:hypothetical protein NA57DRAFT_81216 [Rhizodiscina lignyota]|uniref:Cell wall mannoprotein PIR1-like C-terminal domain-containing protein n=1 Tax=Rhizodiscina lignyota TaxID=1504668 RepID=A0A9P4M5C8_9PEZI|nr:hypothetical protein NA57DRAFT_81216 [Rhizodiscina lignyota]
MRSSIALLALVASVAASPQGVTSAISPAASAPAGCATSYNGEFTFTVKNLTSTTAKRHLTKRQTNGILSVTIIGGVLADQDGRTGYIANNYQLEFANPPQAGAIYTAGFSACTNGSLAFGGSTVWYQCLSGGFYNIYARRSTAQCNPINIAVLPHAASSSATTRVPTSDTATSSASTTATNSTGSRTTGTSSSTTSSSTPSNSAGTNAGDLTPGARAGTGVGVAVGAILVIAVLSIVFFRRRRGKRARANPDRTNSPSGWTKPELEDTHVPVQTPVEVEATHSYRELDSTPVRAELAER